MKNELFFIIILFLLIKTSMSPSNISHTPDNSSKKKDNNRILDNIYQENIENPSNPIEEIITIEQEELTSNPLNELILVNKEKSLPSEFVPEDLVVPNIPFAFEEAHPKKQLRAVAAQALERLFAKAKEDNIELVGVSGYRSFDRQNEIFNYNASLKGVETANQYSAKPGHSEHQTGLAMDLSSSTVNYELTEKFGETAEGKWLSKMAPEYGFIIRYPKGKEETTGYQYEPWHLRYVGIEHAKRIAYNKVTLEEYLYS